MPKPLPLCFCFFVFPSPLMTSSTSSYLLLFLVFEMHFCITRLCIYSYTDTHGCSRVLAPFCCCSVAHASLFSPIKGNRFITSSVRRRGQEENSLLFFFFFTSSSFVLYFFFFFLFFRSCVYRRTLLSFLSL